MNGAKRQLQEMLSMSEVVKKWTDGMVLMANILINEENAHELQDLAREVGSNIATVESNLATLGRWSPFSKKFAVKK